jgi:FixJ family two-component response regulator
MKPPLIVVIDDDPGMRWGIDALLRSFDFQTALFSSAEDYLASDDARLCACLISDVKMAGLSGLDLASRLAVNAEGERIPPIVLISAFTTQTMIDAAFQAGALALLKKPFDADSLMGVIEQAVGRS